MKQIEGLVRNLNSKYASYASSCRNVTDCLRQIAEITPYRYLSTFSHTLAAVQYQKEEDKKKAESRAKFFTPLPKPSTSASTSTRASPSQPDPNEGEVHAADDFHDVETHLVEPAAAVNPDSAAAAAVDSDAAAAVNPDAAEADVPAAEDNVSPHLPPSKDPVPESWEKNYMEFPDHLKYFQKIRLAQKKANDTGKRVQLCWRGYRTSLGPRPRKLKKYDLLQRLIQALKNIRHHKPNEKNVSLF